MAKRRKLTAPSADDLTRIEDEFRRETSRSGAMAPIAQVAAQAAQQAPVVDPEQRAEAAKTMAEAEAYQRAQEKGLVILEIPLTEIDPDDMTRDRADIDEAEMEELRTSIALNGLRLPIEVYELDPPNGPQKYGLISGYRRFLAVRSLYQQSGSDEFSTIRALVREPGSVAAAVAAMVEENEVRANLTQFERGRIAVLAAQNGVFTNVEDAVSRLFASASKAKRSKIRSFALIFEELGDMLAFPQALKEKQGLAVATALRDGAEGQLREALMRAGVQSAAEEWDVLERAMATLDAPERDLSRGGRPSRGAGQGAPVVRTSTGVDIRHNRDARGHSIHLSGERVDAELVDLVIEEVRRLLEQPR